MSDVDLSRVFLLCFSFFWFSRLGFLFFFFFGSWFLGGFCGSLDAVLRVVQLKV